MKRKTYNNVLKVFEEHENGEMPIEWWLDKIISKEEWLKG